MLLVPPFVALVGRVLCQYGVPAGTVHPDSPLSKHFDQGVDIFLTDGNSSTRLTAGGASSGVNLAFGKNATQSSVASSTPSATAAAFDTFDAAKAVDGWVSGSKSQVTLAMTAQGSAFEHGNGDGNPWWEVDLGHDTAVSSVRLWGAEDEPVVVRPEVQQVTLNAGELFEIWSTSFDNNNNNNNNNNGANASSTTIDDLWFTLQFTGARGDTYETRAIAVDAPACGSRGCAYEDLDQTR